MGNWDLGHWKMRRMWHYEVRGWKFCDGSPVQLWQILLKIEEKANKTPFKLTIGRSLVIRECHSSIVE